jgi:hypothetical protein
MPAQRILPSDEELRYLVQEKGLSQSEIARLVEERVGRKISRSAVSVALNRAGLSGPREPRAELMPAGVREDHAGMYPARMLRAESRLRQGLLPESERLRLESWKETLRAKGKGVAYHRCRPASCGSSNAKETGHAEGWFYVALDDSEAPICFSPEAA